MMEKCLYDFLKPLEGDLKTAYKYGAGVSCNFFRDLQIYEEFISINAPKMERYTWIADKFGIGERVVRGIIKTMGKQICC